jgi:hypothetical protein
MRRGEREKSLKRFAGPQYLVEPQYIEGTERKKKLLRRKQRVLDVIRSLKELRFCIEGSGTHECLQSSSISHKLNCLFVPRWLAFFFIVTKLFIYWMRYGEDNKNERAVIRREINCSNL